jgi:hypothetical protein
MKCAAAGLKIWWHAAQRAGADPPSRARQPARVQGIKGQGAVQQRAGGARGSGDGKRGNGAFCTLLTEQGGAGQEENGAEKEGRAAHLLLARQGC